MKAKTILFFALLLNCYVIQAQISKDDAPLNYALWGYVLSEEHDSLSNDFEMTSRLYFCDSLTIDSLVFNLPQNWSIQTPTSFIGNNYGEGDSIDLNMIITNPDTSNLPFYPIKIEYSVFYHLDSGMTASYSVPARVYYTPYNSIEIWNLQDFESLPRRWLNPQNVHDTVRIFVHKDSIPQTDITDFSHYVKDSSNWNDWWVDEFMEAEIPGLAYTVLMKPMPLDTILKYPEGFGDGDTVKSDPKSTNYSGTVSGKVTSKIMNSQGEKTIPIAGIRIRLLEKDNYFGLSVYQNFGETFTKEDGSFSISYNESQWFEGGEIELYLKVIAEDNSTYIIKSTNSIGWTINERYSIGSVPPDAGIVNGDVCLVKNYHEKNEPFRSFHWARRGFQYFDNESVSLTKGLRIKANAMGSWANCYVYNVMPTIFIGTGSALEESTTHHEFGHVTMYKLQNNNIKIPYAEQGVNIHSWPKENTGLLAWLEGWADAIQMILDAAYYSEDDECFTEGSESVPKYEFRQADYPYNIVNGLRSEYYIACAIYDLWDGEGKNLPSSYTYFMGTIHGWNDAGNWSSTDDIEYSLADMCAPLQTVQSESDMENLRNVGQYYKLLLSQNTGCENKDNIFRAFYENKVMSSRSNPSSYLSADGFAYDRCISEYGIIRQELSFIPSLTSSWTDCYPIGIQNFVYESDYYFDACPNADLSLYHDYNVGVVTTNVGEYRTNLFLNSRNNSCNNLNVGDFYTCGAIDIVINHGSLELGSPDGSKVANLVLNEGSVLELDNSFGRLIINDGSTLTVKSGASLILGYNSDVTLFGDAKIILEEGADLFYNDRTSLFLLDNESCIEIAGDLHIASNATFTYTGDGYIKFSNPGGDATNNIFCGSGASIVLQGSGQNDKIMEVQQSSVRFPAELSSLELRDGKIEMGNNKRMLAEGDYPLTFDNIKITSDNGVYNAHRSFHLYGQANVTVSDCIFEYGYWGLYGNLTYASGAPLTIFNSEFKNNKIGLYIYNKGLTLTNCTFGDNTQVGLHADNMSFETSFNSCYFLNNNQGINYQGSVSADLTLNACEILNSTYDGIMTTGGFDLDLNCTWVRNNQDGISTNLGTKVDIANNANNDLSNNVNAIRLNNGYLLADNGYNNLSSSNYAVIGEAVIRCNPGTPPDLVAEHNTWDAYNNDPSYLLNHKLWAFNCNQTPVTILDSNPNSVFCPHKIYSFVNFTNEVNILESESSSESLSGQVDNLELSIQEANTATACQQLLSESITLMENIYGIETAEAYSQSNRIWSNIHNVIDKHYKIIGRDNENMGFNQSVDQVMQLNAQLMLDADAIAYYEYALDNALLERLRGNFDESLLLLDNLIPELEGMDKETAYVNRWICHIEAEREAALRNITPEEFMDAIATCNTDYENTLESLSDNLEPDENAEETSTAPEIHSVPNPNNGNFTLEISDCTEGSSVRISNVYSQPVFTQTFTESGTQTVQITGLSQGHYTVYYLENNAVISSENIVVE